MKRLLIIADLLMSFAVVTSCSDGVTIDSETEITGEYPETKHMRSYSRATQS